jgi:hypothetical protein
MLRTGKGFPAMIAEQESRAIKVAFRLLVEDVGGVEAASAALGYPPGRISEAYALHTQRAPRVDHARRLEALADNPRVTATLARLAGCTLLPQPRLSGDAGLAIAAVLRGAGELGGRAATAWWTMPNAPAWWTRSARCNARWRTPRRSSPGRRCR